MQNIKFAYFGSSQVSIYVLEELEKAGYMPTLIVSTPDKPQGRGLKLAPNVVKEWALAKMIPVISPEKLDKNTEDILRAENFDLFIVASYKKIIPKSIIEMPRHKTLNVHPSMLPAYRGAAPLPQTMLDDAKNTGVTIMRLDEDVDHGPIVAQKEVTIKEWPIYEIFEETMAREGGRLLASVLADWVNGKIKEIPQDHAKATYTKKIAKEDALINPEDDPYEIFRKIQAYHLWPQAYFFIDHQGKKLRVKITGASWKDDKLVIEKVVPEGKKEMSYKDFSTGYKFTTFR